MRSDRKFFDHVLRRFNGLPDRLNEAVRTLGRRYARSQINWSPGCTQTNGNPLDRIAFIWINPQFREDWEGSSRNQQGNIQSNELIK